MFDLGRDDVPALRLLGFDDPTDCEIVRFCAAAEENDLGGLGPDQRCNFLACIVKSRLGLLAEPVDRRSVPEVVKEVPGHCFDHFPAHGRCGIVVEVDVHNFNDRRD